MKCKLIQKQAVIYLLQNGFEIFHLIISDDCRKTLDLVFVVDSSGSIRQSNTSDNWMRMKTFMIDILEKLQDISPSTVRVGLVVFSDHAHNEFFLSNTRSKVQVQQSIRELQFRDGRTDTAFGLYRMRTEQFTIEKGDRPQAPNIAIVITDGESNDNKTRTIPEAQLAKNAGITMFAVGITNFVNKTELRGIASLDNTDSRGDKRFLWEAPNFKQLPTLLAKLASDVCARPDRGKSIPWIPWIFTIKIETISLDAD